jgi:hypothetical protein
MFPAITARHTLAPHSMSYNRLNSMSYNRLTNDGKASRIEEPSTRDDRRVPVRRLTVDEGQSDAGRHDDSR